MNDAANADTTYQENAGRVLVLKRIIFNPILCAEVSKRVLQAGVSLQ